MNAIETDRAWRYVFRVRQFTGNEVIQMLKSMITVMSGKRPADSCWFVYYF